MSSSSPSRRRLLQWAAGAVFSPQLTSAGALELLPGFQRKDPRIRTFTYHHADKILLGGTTIAIESFEAPQAGRPTPPDFAPFLARALEWAFPSSTIAVNPHSHECKNVLIRGRVDLFHRMGAQGLRVNISAMLLETSCGNQRVLWNGTVKADWVRRFPTEDCLLLLADEFVNTWAPQPKD